jgi:hypothetical protein
MYGYLNIDEYLMRLDALSEQSDNPILEDLQQWAEEIVPIEE